MNDVYLEEMVPRKKRASDTVINVGMILLTVIVGIFTIFTANMILVLLFIAACVGCYFVMPRAQVEWEYQYVNGEVDIDRILKKSTRKRMISFDVANVEIIAPLTSHRMDYYNNNSKVKIKDFTSGEEEKKKNIYAAVVTLDGVLTKILFEPSEKMVKDMRTKAPRKVFFD